MADIKQAAKWMQEGERVRRPFLASGISIGFRGRGTWIRVYENGQLAADARVAPFDVEELLAEDWEIAP